MYNNSKVDLSFVIPTLNEEQNLFNLLTSIKQLLTDLRYEIIVVDNGSSDSTIYIATELGAIVLHDSSTTIGGLRNLGASYAQGKILVFLDADMLVTQAWATEILDVIAKMNVDRRIITGSRAGISDSGSWIERYWFYPMTHEKQVNYMNSGHLIVHKEIFQQLGGFDSRLVTSEDWEFSTRARQKGIAIINNANLQVIHGGYPKTLIEFIHREKWHGTQDISSLKYFLNSKPALISALYSIIGILGILISILNRSLICLLIAVTANSLICLIAALNKQKHLSFDILLANFFLYNIYFIARGLSLFTVRNRRPRTGKSEG
mgnify:CR=1 FL=1